MKREVESVLSLKIQEDEIHQFKNLAETYFYKLLKPINRLNEEKYEAPFRDRWFGDIIERREKAIRICKVIRYTNILSEAIFGDPFLKENMRAILELFEPCETENEFIIKILGLASLFEVSMDKLKKVIPNSKDMKNITLVEYWLNNNEIVYEPRMIQTWKYLVSLRNMEPVHPQIDAVKLKEIIEFFGLELQRPQDYHVLWDRILDGYRISLEQWLELLNKLNAEIGYIFA